MERLFRMTTVKRGGRDLSEQFLEALPIVITVEDTERAHLYTQRYEI